MAESAVQRLKRLAAEKRAAAESAKSDNVIVADKIIPADLPAQEPVQEQEQQETKPEPPVLPEPTEPVTLSDPVTLQKVSRNHPLVREMEELEAALEQNVPGFVTILRDIHKKLAADPLTVTLLSREERGVIVRGMTRHANITIATKAVSKTSRSKKTPISVSDL